MGDAKKLSGRITEKNGIWWAYCDQYPVAAHGSSPGDAVGNIVKVIEQYLAAEESTRKRKKQASAPSSSWRFSLQAA